MCDFGQAPATIMWDQGLDRLEGIYMLHINMWGRVVNAVQLDYCHNFATVSSQAHITILSVPAQQFMIPFM